MNRAFRKNIARTIKGSLGRYLAILGIIALGVGFFAGLKMTKPAMIKTADEYVDSHNLFDFRILSTMGFTSEEIAKTAEIDEVAVAEGAVYEDFIYLDETGGTGILRAHSITENVNILELTAGKLPENANEAALDARYFTEDWIGKKIMVAEENPDETKESLAYSEYTVVGLVQSPCYMSNVRGTTSLGNGKLTGFVYLPIDGFSFEYYEELFVSYEHDHEIYSDAYEARTESIQSVLEDQITAMVQQRYEDTVEKAMAELEQARNELKQEVASAEQELADALSQLNRTAGEIEQGQRQLAEAEEQIRRQEAELAASERTLNEQLQLAVQSGNAALQAQIRAGLEQIAAARTELEQAKAELASRSEQLAQAKADWEAGMAEYEQGVKELEEQKAEAEQEFREAEEEIAALEEPSVHVLTRKTNQGYASFENDSGVVDGIAEVFPVFFFLIAALVCSTTMTRMVDDERTQIGIFRALGYSNAAIMAKYFIYSGSAAVIGCVAGYAAGIHLFPYAIWKAYDILYGFADLQVVSDPLLFVICLLVSLLCSVGTTYAACRNELKHMPAELIRPKSPAAGKRIFLERIGFLWKRMKFLHKVSARNIFRFKKRMFMMIIGIAGCTALVVTGYGIRDSISNVVNDQFDEIMLYDVSVTLSEGNVDEVLNNLAGEYGDAIQAHAAVLESSAEVVDSDTSKTVYLIATGDPGIEEVVDLHRNGEPVSYPQTGEVAISESLADDAGVDIGDGITFQYDGGQITLTVSGIFENYLYHYAYISAETYSRYFGEAFAPKTIYLILDDQADEYAVAAYLSEMEQTSTVTVVKDIRSSVENTMSRMNYVVLLVIACAGALAFIVLFNLTNINISERVREIATLKVLGFYPNETRAYVFRENMVLTLMGIAAGLPLGILLHRFVMNQIKVDIVSFEVTILPLSYLYSIVTVLGFTVLVNFLMNGKIEKIPMAESLKSIE